MLLSEKFAQILALLAHKALPMCGGLQLQIPFFSYDVDTYQVYYWVNH